MAVYHLKFRAVSTIDITTTELEEGIELNAKTFPFWPKISFTVTIEIALLPFITVLVNLITNLWRLGVWAESTFEIVASQKSSNSLGVASPKPVKFDLVSETLEERG
jgi:hypothetical protein